MSFLVGSLEKKCRKFALKSRLLASSQNNLPCKVNMRRPRAPPPPPVALLPSPFSHPPHLTPTSGLFVSASGQKRFVWCSGFIVQKDRSGCLLFSNEFSFSHFRAGARTHTYGYFSALRVTWRAENQRSRQTDTCLLWCHGDGRTRSADETTTFHL